jgi:DNA-damage-inducible protein D
MDQQLDFVVKALEAKKKVADNGAEMWSARDLQQILNYETWRRFREVIERAKIASDNSGQFSSNHFVESDEMVEIGSGAKREVENVILSRYACYLVAMNGDASKPEVATAQSYFAVQTYKQETQELLTDEERRLLLRDRVKDANKKLSGAAKDAGVRSQMFGVFHDAGYKGLYGNRGLQAIKKKKGIGEKEDLLDRIGRAELAANEFRITQTEEKLRKEQIKGEDKAINTHYQVGVKVRQTIKDIGGTMPEELPTEPSIKKLTAAKAKEQKKLKDKDEG